MKTKTLPVTVTETSKGNYTVQTAFEILTITAADIAAMRDWVADCVWNDSDEIDEYCDETIIHGVQRHYDGGLLQFQRDGGKVLPFEVAEIQPCQCDICREGMAA